MKPLIQSLVITVFAATVSLSPLRAEEANPWAVTLGATSAQATFSTYMAIAELADLAGAKLYDKEKAIGIATTYAKLTETAKDSLTDLLDSGKVNEDDVASLREIVVINDLLGKTSKSIITYLEEPSDEHEAAYEKARQKSWKALSQFLGLDEAEGEEKAEKAEKPGKEEKEE